MKRLPPHIERKQAKILAALQKGQHWSTMGGNRLRENSSIIVFRLGLRYRTLLRLDTGRVETMTHNAYDKKLKKQILK